jgi:hypothetical protein
LKLVEAFNKAKVSPWTGLAIVKQESSFANRANNKALDERNEANPFSVHFTEPKKWSKDCKKNALLIADDKGEYKSTIAGCSAKAFRLPTFAESAERSARSAKNLKTYREAGGYEEELNERLREILRRIKAKRKAEGKEKDKTPDKAPDKKQDKTDEKARH